MEIIQQLSTGAGWIRYSTAYNGTLCSYKKERGVSTDYDGVVSKIYCEVKKAKCRKMSEHVTIYLRNEVYKRIFVCN